MAEIRVDSSATYKWGVFCLVTKGGGRVWSTAGFFKTEKAAKQHAIDIGADPVLIARRFDRLGLKRSLGVA